MSQIKQDVRNMIETANMYMEDPEIARMVVDMTYATVTTSLVIYLLVRLVWCCCPDPTLAEFVKEIQIRDAKLEEAKSTIEEYEGTIEEHEETIEEQEAEIESLKAEIKELKADYLTCHDAAVDLINRMSKERTE